MRHSNVLRLQTPRSRPCQLVPTGPLRHRDAVIKNPDDGLKPMARQRVPGGTQSARSGRDYTTTVADVRRLEIL